MRVQCEDCKFANWDAVLFRDYTEGWYEGIHYNPPYNEQFDLYCSCHNKFYLETELDFECNDGKYGINNYHDVCINHYREIDAFMKQLRENKEKMNIYAKEKEDVEA